MGSWFFELLLSVVVINGGSSVNCGELVGLCWWVVYACG